MTSVQKVALVTGAGSGIGRASALALQTAGFTVVLAGRRLEALEETRQMGAADGPEINCLATDVSDEASVLALFDDVKQTFGRLDLLFNNAGIFIPSAPTETLSLKDWQSVVDINLTGAFLCAREAVRLMKEQTPKGGRIINNGSISAYSPRTNSVAYTATKHAISGLTKSLSLDGREHSIVCGQLDIGNAATDIVKTINSTRSPGGPPPEATLDIAHCASAVVYMASLPLEANVQNMTIMASTMPFIGRG